MAALLICHSRCGRLESIECPMFAIAATTINTKEDFVKHVLFALLLLAAAAAPARAWNADIFAFHGSVYRFDVDYRSNGDMYLAAIYPESYPDSLSIYRSLDGGSNWSEYSTYHIGGGYRYNDVAVVCGDNNLYVMVPNNTIGAGYYGAMIIKTYDDPTSYNLMDFSDPLHPTEILRVDADRNPAPGDSMYVACQLPADTMYFTKSVDLGNTWTRKVLGSDAAGPHVTWTWHNAWAVVYQYTVDGTYRVLRSANGGTWLFPPVPVDNSVNNFVTSTVTANHLTGKALPAFTKFGSNNDVIAYIGNDTLNSAFSQAVSWTSSDYQENPAIGSDRNRNNRIDLAFLATYNADRYVFCASSNGGGNGTWGSAQVISDHPVEFNQYSENQKPLRIAYAWNGSQRDGPAVFYIRSGAPADSTGIYMDAPWSLTGVGGTPAGENHSAGLQCAACPNPSRGNTVFKYQLPVASDACLAVYNITGQVVKHAAMGRQAAGRHTVEWNANTVPAGVYFYRLTAGSVNITRRMTIIK